VIVENEFSDGHRELYETMSDISEDCYCAGWMMGLEFALWDALQDGDLRYGQGLMDVDQLEKCRTLSTKLDGWIIWIDDSIDAELPASEWGPRFVGMQKWLNILTANKQ
jgi:hypothetical protein